MTGQKEFSKKWMTIDDASMGEILTIGKVVIVVVLVEICLHKPTTTSSCSAVDDSIC